MDTDRTDVPSRRRMAGPGIIAIGIVLAFIVVMLMSAGPDDTIVTPTKNGVTPTVPAPSQSTTVTPSPPTPSPTQPVPPTPTPAAKPPQ